MAHKKAFVFLVALLSLYIASFLSFSDKAYAIVTKIEEKEKKKGNAWFSFLFETQLIKANIDTINAYSHRVLFGVDFAPYQNFEYGIFGSYGQSTLNSKSNNTKSSVIFGASDDYSFGVQGKIFLNNNIVMLLGGSFSHSILNMFRYVALGEAKAIYPIQAIGFFSEFSYPIEYNNSIMITPFIDFRYSAIHMDVFSETIENIEHSRKTGTQKINNIFSSVGLRLKKNITENFLINGSASFRTHLEDHSFVEQRILEPYNINGYKTGNTIVIHAGLEYKFDPISVHFFYERQTDIWQKFYHNIFATTLRISF